MYRGVIFLQVFRLSQNFYKRYHFCKKILCVKPLHCFQKQMLLSEKCTLYSWDQNWWVGGKMGTDIRTWPPASTLLLRPLVWQSKKYNCRTIFRAAIHTFLKLVESIFSAKKIDGKVCKSHPQNFVTQMSKSWVYILWKIAFAKENMTFVFAYLRYCCHDCLSKLWKAIVTGKYF